MERLGAPVRLGPEAPEAPAGPGVLEDLVEMVDQAVLGVMAVLEDLGAHLEAVLMALGDLVDLVVRHEPLQEEILRILVRLQTHSLVL